MNVSDNPYSEPAGQASERALRLASDKPERAKPISCDELRQWVRTAQPNARLIYGHGSNASQCCGAKLRELVWELSEKGYVTPHGTKLGGAKVQIVMRTHRPVLKGATL